MKSDDPVGKLEGSKILSRRLGLIRPSHKDAHVFSKGPAARI